MSGTSEAVTRQGVQADRFRDLMAAVCAPVTVVTTTTPEGPHGATVSSFASLSLDPPLVSVAFDNNSSMLARILSSNRFGVNLLSNGQQDIATTFASRSEDRFAGVRWHLEHDLPRLDGAAGWVECDLDRAVQAGDHTLLFGLVVATSRIETAPLIYVHRTFGTHSRFNERPRALIVDQIAACAS